MPVLLEDQLYCIPCAFICIAGSRAKRRRTCPQCGKELTSVRDLPLAITQAEDFTTRIARLRELNILHPQKG